MLSLLGVVTGVTSIRAGVTAPIVNEFTERLLLVLLALSATVMVQLLWVPSERALNVTVLLPAIEVLSELLQSPP